MRTAKRRSTAAIVMELIIHIIRIMVILGLLWIGLSVVEVIIKNGMGNPVYTGINFFNLLIK